MFKEIKELTEHMAPFVDKYKGSSFDTANLSELFTYTIDKYISKPDKNSRYAAWNLFLMFDKTIIDKLTVLRLAAMLIEFKDTIKAGIAPTLWQGEKTRASMLCLGVNPAPNTKGKRSLVVSLICMQGTPAGLLFKVVLSCNLIEYILGKKLGVSFKKYNAVAEELAGCVFRCMVSEDTSRSYLSDYDATASMKKHNKNLAEARCSLNKCKTPLIPCSVCKKKRNECNKAVWR